MGDYIVENENNNDRNLWYTIYILIKNFFGDVISFMISNDQELKLKLSRLSKDNDTNYFYIINIIFILLLLFLMYLILFKIKLQK